jgi:uncharacterized protein (TIGR02466 family)
MEFRVFEQALFTTPLWECPVTGIDNDSLKKYCNQVRKEKQGVVISNRGGWHSNDLIYPLPTAIDTLFTDLTAFVNDVCVRYTGMDNLAIGNFWININGPYDYNTSHHHQGSILSGVYYVSVPSENMGDLVLERGDMAEHFLTSDIEKKYTLSNALEVRKPAKEGTFYLFPSWIKHRVERNESQEERISIAFNILPKSKL